MYNGHVMTEVQINRNFESKIVNIFLLISLFLCLTT